MLEPIGHDGQGAPPYPHQVVPVSIINARDCELAGFDLGAVLHDAATLDDE